MPSKIPLGITDTFFSAGDSIEAKLEDPESLGNGYLDKGSGVKQAEDVKSNTTVSALLQSQQQGSESQVHANSAQVSSFQEYLISKVLAKWLF